MAVLLEARGHYLHSRSSFTCIDCLFGVAGGGCVWRGRLGENMGTRIKPLRLRLEGTHLRVNSMHRNSTGASGTMSR
jgi:hypothetical protein